MRGGFTHLDFELAYLAAFTAFHFLPPDDIAQRLKQELDVEVAPFDALDLMDYLSEVLGPHFYNQGLYDAQTVLKARMDTIAEAVEALEQPVTLR